MKPCYKKWNANAWKGPITNPDPYFKKTIPYTCKGQQFSFAVAHTLFSSFAIDKGSDLLLRTLTDALDTPKTLLDIGCGVGVLGIVLARLFPQAQAVLVDKDLLAVRYAQHNCQHNAVLHVQVVGSVGLEQVPPGPYDLIVSNIPAKIGEDAIEHEFLLAPRAVLAPGGAYWFVIVSALNHLIPRLGRQHHLNLKEMKKRTGYTVYRLLQ